MSKAEILRRWRKLKMPGRLYWKRANWRWRNFFEGDDIAVWRDSPMSMHFKAYSAIEEFIEYCEWVTNEKREC